MLTINITGHRPQKLFGFIALDDPKYAGIKHAMKVAVKHLIDEHGEKKKVVVISGMALGIDQIFVEAMVDARRYYRSIGVGFDIVAAVPCKNHSSKWPPASQADYKKLLEQCDRVEVLQEEYTRDCLERRNLWMVERSDATIAVWNGGRGGTADCVRDAAQKGNEILVIDPKTASIRKYNN